MDGVTIVQTIDASYPVIEWAITPAIIIAGVAVMIVGIIIAAFLNFHRVWLFALGAFIAVGGALFLAFAPIEHYEVPQTNYVILCSPDVSISELTQKYKIVDQVGNGLIVTDRYPATTKAED